MSYSDVRRMFPHKIRIDVFTRADMATIGDAVFDAIEADPDFAPQKFGRYEPFKAGPREARQLWQEEAAKSFGLLGGDRKRPFHVGFDAKFGIDGLQPFHMIYMSIDPTALRHDGAKRIEALFRRLVGIADPYWASAEHSADFERQNVYLTYPTSRGTIQLYRIVGYHPEEAIPGLYWLNYFGPQFTALMPRALTAPGCGAERFGSGVLMKLADDPEAMLLPENIARAERCKRELGELLFFDRNRAEPDPKLVM